jgi:hypothetical protein
MSNVTDRRLFPIQPALSRAGSARVRSLALNVSLLLGDEALLLSRP